MKESKTTCEWCFKNVREVGLWYIMNVMCGDRKLPQIEKIPDETHFCSIQCVSDYFNKVKDD